jgi:hypothetical protein
VYFAGNVMDKNKQEELRRIGYRIPKTCALCVHGVFPSNEWGTCAVRTYDHQKHSDAKRQLSIVQTGSCTDLFELDETKAARLGAYREFI